MSKIYVDSIASKTGAADALTIDSSGVVSHSTPVAVEATMSTTQAYTASDHVRVNFDTVVNESGGSNFSTSNYEFVVPSDGWYQVNANVYLYSVNKVTIQIRKNGVRYLQVDAMQASGNVNPNGASVAHAIQFSANDAISIWAASPQSGSIYNNADNKTYLSIIKLA
jgi:hypothetical protein